MDFEQWRATQETVRVETEYHEFDVAYRDVGAGDPVTVFLHGIPHWGFLFREVLDAVDHAVVPDLVGYGYTEHVGPGGYDRSIRVQQEAMTSFLDELGHDSVRIVAHDIGGAVALRLAIFTDHVEKLVLSNVACYDSFPVSIMHELGLPAEARAWDAEDLRGKLDRLFRRPSHARRDDAEAVDEYVAGMKAPFLDPGRELSDLSRNASATNTNETLEIVPRHGEVTAPTLLLWGADNRRRYETSVGKEVVEGQHTGFADRLAVDLPNAETKYLDGAGHNVMLDRPGAYRDGLAAFLD